MKWLLFTAAMALAGCVRTTNGYDTLLKETKPDFVAIARADKAYAERQVLQDSILCTGFGFTVGTTAYSNCLMYQQGIRDTAAASINAPLEPTP